MTRGRPTTVRDVARAAGVSPKTVSNVVGGYAPVSPATRARVLAQVEALGYRPQAAGRQLRQGRTGVVTLALPAVDRPYFADLAGHVVRAARAEGLTVVVEQTDGDVGREREVAAGLPTRMADGLLLSPLALTADELVALPGVPTVLMGEHAADVPLDRVVIDSVAVARTATEHLLALGRRRVAVVGVTDPLHRTASQRVAGWRAALLDAGAGEAAADPALSRAVGGWTREDGAAAGRVLARERAAGLAVDAVLALDDTLALGLLQALRDEGVAVPGEVAVVGVDDVPESAFAWPALTTVAIDRAVVAREAVRLLVTRLAEPDLPPRAVPAPVRLVVRASTAG